MGIQTNQKTIIFTKNMNFHLTDLTVSFYAFDFNTHDCSPDKVNAGDRVVLCQPVFET